MTPKSRTLLRVMIPDAVASMGLAANDVGEEEAIYPLKDLDNLVDDLMGKNAEARFNFIQDNAEFVSDLDI